MWHGMDPSGLRGQLFLFLNLSCEQLCMLVCYVVAKTAGISTFNSIILVPHVWNSWWFSGLIDLFPFMKILEVLRAAHPSSVQSSLQFHAKSCWFPKIQPPSGNSRKRMRRFLFLWWLSYMTSALKYCMKDDYKQRRSLEFPLWPSTDPQKQTAAWAASRLRF